MLVTIKKQNFEINRIVILELIRQKTGKSLKRLASEAGYVSQQIQYWYKNDNLTIEQLYKIAEAQNLKVEAAIEANNPFDNLFEGVVEIDGTTIEICGVSDLNTTADELFATCPEVLERAKGGKLKFLADFIIRNKMPYSSFGRKVGVNPTQLKLWMELDNIKLSKLYNIAEAFGTKIKWKLTVS